MVVDGDRILGAIVSCYVIIFRTLSKGQSLIMSSSFSSILRSSKNHQEALRRALTFAFNMAAMNCRSFALSLSAYCDRGFRLHDVVRPIDPATALLSVEWIDFARSP